MRVQLKLAKLGGSQRDAFGHNFALLRRLLSSEGEEEEEAGASDAATPVGGAAPPSAPPSDRLARQVVARGRATRGR